MALSALNVGAFAESIDFGGTSGRAEFLVCLLVATQIAALLVATINWSVVSGDALFAIFTPPALIGAFLVVFSAAARRLNDMGWSAQWLRYSVLFAPIALFAHAAYVTIGASAFAYATETSTLILVPTSLALVMMLPAWGAPIVTAILSLIDAQSGRASS